MIRSLSLAFLISVTSAFAQNAAIKAPPLAAGKAEMKQGLTLVLAAAGKNDTRAARLVSLYVPVGQPASPFLAPGAFTARWEGNIMATLRSEFTFSTVVSGTVAVTMNGVKVIEGAEPKRSEVVQLNKGANALVVEYESPAQGDAAIRLNWTAKEFPTEPVPPTVFAHDVSSAPLREAARVREGRLLFAQLNCVACHDSEGQLPAKMSGEGMPELAQDAPAFGEFGSRFNEAWLAHWINNPHDTRPGSLMPRVFTGPKDQVDQRAADLAAYLVSMGARKDAAVSEDDVPLGAALFANLGCISCHSQPGQTGDDEHLRVPLSHLKAKWQAPALGEYLKDPLQNYKWSRMPNFRLSDDETKQLTAYLLSGEQREFAAGPAGDAGRGAQLLVSANCLNCHAGLPPTATPKLAATLKSGWERGCMAPDDASRGTAPDFLLTAVQRESLLAFAAAGFESLKQDTAVEFAHRQMNNLRCGACHAQDGKVSLWSSLEGEMVPLQSGAPVPEGEGVAHASTALPMLTWLGEKLQPDWAASFIAGGIPEKPRPWIIGRMPGFGERATLLAAGMAHDHGFSAVREKYPPVDLEFAKAGETLISENGGFNCTTCHAVGDRAATAVFEAPGPNLIPSVNRLRLDYYTRWVMHPLRIDPETKMPRFSDDEGKTPLTDFFEGDARKQFNSIWEYLRAEQK